MKLIVKTIISLILISLTCAAKLSSSNSNKVEGEGEYGKGLRVRTWFGTSAGWSTNWEKETKYSFMSAKDIADGATGENKNGIVFDFKEGAPSDATKKYLKQFSGNKYFLPYRNMVASDPSCKYISSSGINRRIEMSFVTDAGEDRVLKIIFPYARFSSYITPGQLIKTFNSIKSLAESSVNSITSEKSGMVVNTQNILDNAAFLNSAKKGGADIKAKVEEQKNLLKTNTASVKTKQGELEGLEKKVAEAYKAYTIAKNLANGKKAEIEQLSNANNVINISVGNFDKNGSDNKKVIENFTKIENEFKSKIDAQGAALKTLAIKQGANIDAAVTAAKAAKLADTKASLAKFRPL